MAHITFSDGVAIVMLAFYTFCLPFSVIVCLRHGLARASGWIFLSIFSILRIIGCSAQLATITQGASGTPATISEITQALGLSPLLLASLGLLTRLLFSILSPPWNAFFSLYFIKVIQIPCIVGLILCIVGATNASSPTEIFQQDTLRAGLIIFTVVLGALSILYMSSFVGYRKTGRGEPQLVVALGASLPFLLVRLVYSLLECFGSHAPGSVLASYPGAEILELFLANIEEMIITLIYISAGMAMHSVPAGPNSTGPGNQRQKLQYRALRGDFGGGKLGIISMLVALISKAFKGAKEDHRDQEMHHRDLGV